MTQRNPSDWPRLSGRPQSPVSQPAAGSQTVFRRFFELIERLEKPPAPSSGKAQPPAPRVRR